VTDRPRLLLIGHSAGPLDAALAAVADVEPVSADPGAVAARLAGDPVSAVVASPEALAALMARLARAELVVAHIEKGLAVLRPDGEVYWANDVYREWTGGEPVGRPFLDSLACDRVSVERTAGDDHTTDPLAPARGGAPAALRLHRTTGPDRTFLDADVRPALSADNTVGAIVVMLRDVTAEVLQQQKLDALHAAGRTLAGLDADQLTDMNVEARVELLKANLRRAIHDVLHYDTIEVRLLDRKTSELKPLLEDGMLPEAAGRVLFARATENGLTGLVAATGNSYLCRDAASDPHYIAGAAGARSSMTVALKYQNEVVGTLNVESPHVNGFGPDDLQFTELFSRDIAEALHTLELLSAQQVCTAGQSIEAVNKEIALPLDEVLAGASAVLARVAVADPDAASRLRRVLEAARQVQAGVSRVGRALVDAATGEKPLAGKRVLVVESDERLRRQSHLLLERLGATAETAGTAEDGIALAAAGAYDAIFQEVKPPDSGGYDCYRRLRSACPGAPVALTTGFGYDAAHSIVKARADGMRHVLFKPFRQDQVVRAVLEGDRVPPS
jgi:two-component system, sensor histidine kinase SagS